MYHAATITAALLAGKHVYVEKPLATTVSAAREVLAAAAATGRVLGSAPDTFLGSASQTARRAMDDGLIGEPVGASMFVGTARPSGGTRTRASSSEPGGGPVLDMGPYYVRDPREPARPDRPVAAASRIGAPVRPSPPQPAADSVEVEVATHASAILTFASGCSAPRR